MDRDWLNHFGIALEALPDCAGTKAGKLVIVGGAREVWEDLSNLNVWQADVMCINDIGMHMPHRYQHWFSLHGDQLPVWAVCRRFRYQKHEPDLHTTIGSPGNNYNYPQGKMYKWPWPGHGSSGLNAAYTGLGLGYNDIVLAGVPYAGWGHYFDPPEGHGLWEPTNLPPQFDVEGFRRLWTKANNQAFKGRVRSMSGMTREILGAP